MEIINLKIKKMQLLTRDQQKSCETAKLCYIYNTKFENKYVKDFTKKLCKDFEIKNLGDYHDSYVQGDTLMLADVFENFRNMS